MSRALAKIHIAKKELGLHEEDYRDILERCTGARSSSGLNDKQIGAVLDEFKALGWKPKVYYGGNPSTSKSKVADFESAKKARALWISLWQLGAIRDKSESALEIFARRQLKVDAFKWANQQEVYKLIEALKSMAFRAGWQLKHGQSLIEQRQLLIKAQCEILNITQPDFTKEWATHIPSLIKQAQDFGNEIQGVKR